MQTRCVKIRKAYDECRALSNKLEAIDKTASRTKNAYILIHRMLDKIRDLTDDAFDISKKKRIQRLLKQSLEDVQAIGYDDI